MASRNVVWAAKTAGVETAHRREPVKAGSSTSNILRRRAECMLAGTGVTLDGDEPWDIRIRDSRVFARVAAQGSLGFGDAYVDGWWECDDLPECLTRLVRDGVDARSSQLAAAVDAVRHRLMNAQLGRRAWTVGRRHYDLGDDLFGAMLGRRLIYSCGYWASANELDQAQLAKLDLVCRKVGLKPGMRVLDIGCGWGEALKYAAEHYGITGVGITISADQANYARKLCSGLPIEIRLSDYRKLRGSFDAVMSIGMFEHVGWRNFPAYFNVVSRCLEPSGLCLLHTIGTQLGTRVPDRWIERHIFPNSVIPRLDDVMQSVSRQLVVEDLENFGLDYVRTLREWWRRFDDAWPRLEAKYGGAFRRMWHFYLAASIASFSTRRNHLWQLVLTHHARITAYRRPA